MSRPYVNSVPWRNRKVDGYSDVTETGVVPGADYDYTVELDERIVPNGTLVVVSGGDTLTLIPYGMAPGADQVAVSYDLPLLKFHSSRAAEAYSVEYTPGGGVLTSARFRDFGLPATQVFEVNPDGSRKYSTIQAALADATDALVRKVILLYPGDYDVGTTPIEVSVDNTHIVGIAKEAVRVFGTVDIQEPSSPDLDGIFNIRADNCGLENLVVENTALDTFTSSYKASALNVYQSVNFTATNCRFQAFADNPPDPSFGNDGWDTIYIRDDSTAVLNNCEIYGGSDTISVNEADVTINNCVASAYMDNGSVLWLLTTAARTLRINGLSATVGDGGNWMSLNGSNWVVHYYGGWAKLSGQHAPWYVGGGDGGTGNVVNISGVTGRFFEPSGVTINLAYADGRHFQNLNASSLSSGTVANARLHTNLQTLSTFGSNGICVRTGSGSTAARTITTTDGRLSVANGDGVSGNPVITMTNRITKPNAQNVYATAGNANYTLGLNDVWVQYYTLTPHVATITLPALSAVADGHTVFIAGFPASTGTATLKGDGSDNIDNGSTFANTATLSNNQFSLYECRAELAGTRWRLIKLA